MKDGNFYFVKCEKQKKLFCEIWGTKKFILWNSKNYILYYIKYNLIILSIKNDYVQGAWWILTKQKN